MTDREFRTESVFSGIRWSGVAQVIRQILQVGVSIALARLIAPEHFGVLSMATVVTNFVLVFQQLGTNTAIIQKRDVSDALLASVNTLSVAVGLFLTAAVMLTAPIVAAIYEEPVVTDVLRVLGCTFVVTAISLVPTALLNRDLRFDRLVPIELFSFVVQATTAITLAAIGWGVWALVASAMVSAVLRTALFVRVSPWRLRFGFQWSEIRGIIGFSANVTGFSIVHYFSRNADRFVIGRFVGKTPLGHYSFAYQLYMYPIASITVILMRVMFPAFSRLQDDIPHFKKLFLRANGGIAFLTFPMMVGLSVIARPFVLGCLGEPWAPMIPLVTILAPIGMLQSIATTTGQVYLAKGRSDLRLWWGVGSTVIIVMSFFVGVWLGEGDRRIITVAISYAVVMLPLTYLSFWFSFRLIDMQLRDLLRTLRPYFVMSGIMGAIVLGCHLALAAAGLPPLAILAVCVPLGAAVYVGQVLWLKPRALWDLLRMIPPRFQPTRLMASLAKYGDTGA